MPEYRTPGVYIEEISSGPRPVQPSSTTNTGFLAVLTLPVSFIPGRGLADGMLLPAAEERVRLAWNRALAFRKLDTGLQLEAPAAAPAGDKKDAPKDAPKPAAPAAGGDSRLRSLLAEALPGQWTVAPAKDPGVVTLTSVKGETLRFAASRTLLSIRNADDGPQWELAFGADDNKLLETISAHALKNGVVHSGNLACVDGKAKPVTIRPEAIHERLAASAPSVTSMTGYHQWRHEFGEKLFKEIVLEKLGDGNVMRAQAIWEGLSYAAREAWDNWLRSHPGIFRLELALQGFFENGGATAYIACAIQAHGAAGPNKSGFLAASFDSQPSVAMLAAPGLDFGWQQAILQYAGPKGRGDLFAVLDTPRFLLTQAPRNVELDDFRWTKGDAPYEVGTLQVLDSAKAAELRFLGYANDELLDRTIPRDDTGYGAAYGPWLIVDNPLSTGSHDRYVVAPPAGHIAGVIAATDLKAGGGVHKAPANEQVMGVADLVTEVSDREQGALNTKSVNIIRHRPGGGIRVWGARTVGADALWRYVNVRRIFLFVERSIRDAVNWAVFLPNSDTTRRDLATTIRSFLYSLWAQGMLDGASHSEAYSVQCDKANNPDVDVRSGILTVDVVFKPLYPAEFVRIRFRQAPMEVPA